MRHPADLSVRGDERRRTPIPEHRVAFESNRFLPEEPRPAKLEEHSEETRERLGIAEAMPRRRFSRTDVKTKVGTAQGRERVLVTRCVPGEERRADAELRAKTIERGAFGWWQDREVHDRAVFDEIQAVSRGDFAGDGGRRLGSVRIGFPTVDRERSRLALEGEPAIGHETLALSL